MTDNSLLGFGHEPQEVDAVLDALVGVPGEDDDAHTWYLHLSSRQALLDAAVKRIADLRAATVFDMYQQEDRMSLAQVADRLGISRARAQQLVGRGRAQSLMQAGAGAA